MKKGFGIHWNTMKNNENALEYNGITCKTLEILQNTMEYQQNYENALEFYGIPRKKENASDRNRSFVVPLHNGFVGVQHISVSHAMQDKLKVIM